jgi:catechol 2,3-dioxygenase-like lactoylglutathione lyase family enzyme
MNKSMLSLLALTLLGVVIAVLPGSGRAATLHEGDYVRIGVPNLPQAVSFFRDVLDCQLIGAMPAAPIKTRNANGSQLLACETGSIVELFHNRTDGSPSSLRRAAAAAGEPIRFVSGNVAHADQWLHRAGVHVVGPPQKLRSGPFVGMTVVNFVSPWGLHLQLMGWDTNVAAAER